MDRPIYAPILEAIFTPSVVTIPDSRVNVPLDNPEQWEVLGWLAGGGVNVNEESALRLGAVWACTRVLGESMASLPFSLFKYTSNDRRNVEPGEDHNLYNLVTYEPSPLYSSYTWREAMQNQLSLNGNSFSEIVRQRAGGDVKRLDFYPNNQVEIKIKNRRPYYRIRIKDETDKAKAKYRAVAWYNMLHIPALTFDGITGLSPLTAYRESVNLGLTSQAFAKTYLENGAKASGAITHPQKLRDQAYKRLKRTFDETYAGSDNAGKTLILEEGMQYKQFTYPSLLDAQYIDAMKFTVEDIARIFRVPPHMVGALERATNNNIEQQAIDFVVHTLRPWVKRWEAELNRKLLLNSDKRQYFVRFNINALMRGDSAARAEFYNKLYMIGVLNANEIRALENMNAYEGGNEYYRPLNMENAKTNNNGTE